jgi:hypothetical protein
MKKLIQTTQMYKADMEEEKLRQEDEHAQEVADLLEALEQERAMTSQLREDHLRSFRQVAEQLQEYERVNEERLRAAAAAGDEIVESVAKVKFSTRRGKLTEVLLLTKGIPGAGDDDGDDDDPEDKTRSAKELELAMQLRCLQKENQFLINKLAEEKRQHGEELLTERRATEGAIDKMKELIDTHRATLTALDEAQHEADEAKRAVAELKQEADALRTQLRSSEMAQALATASPAPRSKKPTWGQLARGSKKFTKPPLEGTPASSSSAELADHP